MEQLVALVDRVIDELNKLLKIRNPAKSLIFSSKTNKNIKNSLKECHELKK
jgi:hypothetical protein